MFASATKFNQNLSKWNVERVQDFSCMFANAIGYEGTNISNWNTNNGINMAKMFYGAISFNHNISNWNTSKVNRTDLMFHNASLFNQDISNWNISNVKDFNHMFEFSTSFQQDLCLWGNQLLTLSSSNDSSINVTGMFLNTSCEDTASPDNTLDNNSGPWCTIC